MKILVFSDSHGNLDNMIRAVAQEAPDQIFHLGDGWRDAQRLHARFPQLPFCHVPGNCDLQPGTPAERLLEIQGKRILLCHGHTYGVKRSLTTAGFAAQERDLAHEEMHSRVDYLVAHGISSTVGREKVIIGSAHFVFEDEGCRIPEGEQAKFDALPAAYSHLYLSA